MVKVANSDDTKPDKQNKITVGELVMRQTEEQAGKKWEEIAKGFDTSKFLPLRDAIEKTRLLGEMLDNYPPLNNSFHQMAQMQRQLVEPIKKLAEPIRQINEQVEKLNKAGVFNLPTRLFSTLDNLPKLTIPELPGQRSEAEFEPQLTYTQPPIVALRNQVSNLEERLEDMSEQVTKTVTEQFDKFAKQVNIPIGFKNANCQCKFCGNVLVKFEGVFFFTQGTMKCGSCGKLLQLPRDMKITAT